MGFFDKIDDLAGSMAGSIKDAAEDVIEFVDDKVDMPVIIDINGIKRAGSTVNSTARETSSLCNTTIDKASEVVAFGLELKETLDGLTDGGGGDGSRGVIDASKFEIIKDLVDGDRIRAATALAGELGDLALQCVDKSQDMIEAIEGGIDSLPDVIEDKIEDKMDAANDKGGKDSDPDLPDVELHSRELETLISDVENVNLFTVMSSGKQAFDGLRSKGELCQGMFSTIKDFSEDISEVSDAIKNFKLNAKSLQSLKDLVKNAWRCLRLSSLIKAFAEGVGKIIKWIVSLFKRASEKLGSIWGALARTKDILADCMQYILKCMKLCDDAKDRSVELTSVSDEIRGHLGTIISVNRKSISSIKDLSDGDEIKKAIQLATTMDDIVKECVMQILETIKNVCGAIKSMPDVLKEGVEEAGGGEITGTTRAISFGLDDDDGDSPPEDSVDVEGDVEELDGMRSAIEEANVLECVGKSADGFDGIKTKIGICGDMIMESRGFADNCSRTIESFGGAWDLESAQGHILELFEIVSLGKLIKHFALQIDKLIRANIAVMEAVMKKFKDIDFVPDEIEDFISDIVPDQIEDAVKDGMKHIGKKMAFWKK